MTVVASLEPGQHGNPAFAGIHLESGQQSGSSPAAAGIEVEAQSTERSMCTTK